MRLLLTTISDNDDGDEEEDDDDDEDRCEDSLMMIDAYTMHTCFVEVLADRCCSGGG